MQKFQCFSFVLKGSNICYDIIPYVYLYIPLIKHFSLYNISQQLLTTALDDSL